MSDLSVHERIRRGDYNTPLPYPDHVPKPAILFRSADNLTAAELASIPQIQADYEAAKKKRVTLIEAYRVAGAEADVCFWADVFAEHGMDPQDPFVQEMKRLAWDNGHSNGLAEVLMHFEELTTLYE